MIDTNVAIHSLTQKACHTPTAPKTLEKIYASGRIQTIYLNKEMINDPFPFPNPSNTPQTMTETEDTKKPQLMIRNAC